MCQLLGLSSSDPIRMTFDWQAFAMHGSKTAGNPDGWGVAYFDDVDAVRVREPAPAANSPMVQFLANHAPRSNLVISHVRRATEGGRKLANTQPFTRVLAGRTHVFAHNGYVPPLQPDPSSTWLRPQGDTDSELLFCRLLGYLEPLWRQNGIPALERRFDIVQQFAREILPLGAANFLYSDGVTLFAHGHRQTLPGDEVSDEPGLFLSMYRSKTGSDMATPCHGVRAEGSCSHQALVATQPLNENEWMPLKPGEIICLERGRRVR